MLALAVWNGWRQGFVVQICSLAGIVAGIWIAARFGAQVGGWLRLDDEVAAAGGFVTALVVVILVVAIAGRVVRKVFHFAGLGVADTLLGIAVSVLKLDGRLARKAAIILNWERSMNLTVTVMYRWLLLTAKICVNAMTMAIPGMNSVWARRFS